MITIKTILDINLNHITQKCADIVKYEIENTTQRTPFDVQLSVLEEFGELCEEYKIKYGNTYKKEGADGILGESIDLLICLIDYAYITQSPCGKDLVFSVDTTLNAPKLDFDVVDNMLRSVCLFLSNPSEGIGQNAFEKLITTIIEYLCYYYDSGKIEDTLNKKLDKWESKVCQM